MSGVVQKLILNVPPPPVDCTAVVESPARKNAGGFSCLLVGVAAAKDSNCASAATFVFSSIMFKN